MIAIDNMLGVGIYSPREAAIYARVHTQTMLRWFWGRGDKQRVTAPQFDEANEDKTVTFLDLIQALAIRNARYNYGVPLAKIRQAIDNAKQELGVEYPLARKHVMYLFGSELFIGSPDKDYSQVSGSNRNQKVITQVFEYFMEDIGYDAESGLANVFTAYRYRDREVIIRPNIRMGEPIVEGCGYSAQTLWQACIAEGGIGQAAKAYEVDRKDVEAAFVYMDYLQQPLASSN